jgi:3-oxoacyl-[acyl-carrier protein] reductase
MELQGSLAVALMFTQGNTEQVRAAFVRAIELARSLGDARYEIQLLRGYHIYLTRLSDFRGSLHLGERSEVVAKLLNNPADTMMAAWMVGVAHHLIGNQREAVTYCESAMTGALPPRQSYMLRLGSNRSVGAKMGQRFAGRVAVVTGGVSGIGAGIAARLAADGARVSIWDHDAAALAKAEAAHTVSVDVADAEAVQRAADATATALGKIDILIACAGITGPVAPVWEYQVAAWDSVIDVNLNGVFYCNRAAVPHMLRNGYGRIVNIASIAGKEGNPNAAAYSASKAGVIGLTKSLGKELANTNVRVNCVTPAAVRTPLFAQMTQEHIDFMLSKIPLGRFGEIDEIASLVCWLASEECSFSTGAAFDISGGRATY